MTDRKSHFGEWHTDEHGGTCYCELGPYSHKRRQSSLPAGPRWHEAERVGSDEVCCVCDEECKAGEPRMYRHPKVAHHACLEVAR